MFTVSAALLIGLCGASGPVKSGDMPMRVVAPWKIEIGPGTLEWAEVKTKDGTTLYGSLLKPADFDPQKRYPVVVPLVRRTLLRQRGNKRFPALRGKRRGPPRPRTACLSPSSACGSRHC
jgi:hypothetical protein